jgi:Ser-tRNA(Ala) deacylase AlaX
MNIFLSTDATEHQTKVTDTRSMADGRLAVAVAENIIRPAGGGQPRDYGFVDAEGGPMAVASIFKDLGTTWLELDCGDGAPVGIGDWVTLRVDDARRRNLSRAHSLTHLAMAVIREHVAGYQSKGANIDEGGELIELRFLAGEPVGLDLIHAVDRRTRSLMHEDIPIFAEKVRSVADAEANFRHWRVDPDLSLNGRIRVIHIDGVDSNPCSGSHVSSTGDIGPFAFVGHRRDGLGVNRIALRRQDVWSYWY